MLVSVIVPVYKGLGMLKSCLNALENQTYSEFEIIVVDNGGNSGIGEVCSAYSKVQLIQHETPGSYSARNAGIRAASGEIIALTDADCIPSPNWIENGVNGMLYNSCRMASGHITPAFTNESKPGFIELCDVILHTMNQEQALRECTSVACANMFVHKSLFNSVGLFNDSLFSAGDCEFTYRVSASGEKIVYLENAVIYHRARRTLKEVVQRYRRFAGAEFASMTGRCPQQKVSHLRSLSFGYRVMLCFKNILNGIKRYKQRNPILLFLVLILVESFITIIKILEYLKLSTGGKMQR